ncbi:MAG: squalene synthase HpnC [Actinobacteria bacterium]|nr:squalene synthase HpnC [Actinomycetota bacterium]
MSAENFPVALRVLPPRVRADLESVYTFARFVDDVGDEAPGDSARRLVLLAAVDRDLDALSVQRSTLSPVVGLRDVVRRRGVPLDPFHDLVAANRADQSVTAYQTFDDLLGYCRLSAAPVGRIVLHVAGAATQTNVADSDAVCAALQVLEHCQDVREDARVGRVYLPALDLVEAGVDPDELSGTATSPALRRVVAQQVQRSRELLRAGPPLVRRLRGWARLAVAGYVAGGLATAEALEAADFDVLGQAVRPGKAATARHALRLAGRPW